MPEPQVFTSVDQVVALVARIRDRSRQEPVLVVTTKQGAALPLLDAEGLAAAVDPLPVLVVPTGPLTWELTGLLPDGMSVFGGASRIWWPGYADSDDMHRHPLVFVWTADQADDALRRVVGALRGRGHRTLPPTPPSSGPRPTTPEPEAVVDALVLDAMPGGAEVQLAGGLHGWYRFPRKSAPAVYGDTVQVRFLSLDEDGRAVLGTPPRVREAVPEPPAKDPGDRPRPGPPRAVPAADAVHVLEATDDRDTLIAELQSELTGARAEVKGLRGDVTELEQRLADAESGLAEAVRAAKRQVQDLKRDLKSARDRSAHLENQLHGIGRHEDPDEQFRHEVARAWERNYVGNDRAQWPPRPYVLGTAFLRSVDELAGIDRRKIADVAADVVTGRAAQMPIREHHALRTGVGGEDPHRMRFSDGALAYRVSLQQFTPAARRLHYWRLPDGMIELANVCTHDVMTIS